MSAPSTVLGNAIVANAAAAGLRLRIAAAKSVDWASATFVGHRHRFACTVAGDPAAWLATLPEVEWHLPGHLVAAVAAERAGRRLTIGVLTLHDHRPDDSSLI